MTKLYATTMTVTLKVEADNVAEARCITRELRDDVANGLPVGASCLPGMDACGHTVRV